MLSLGVAALGAAPGCGSEVICDVGCLSGGTATTRFPSAGPGRYDVTLCMGERCEAIIVQLPQQGPGESESNGERRASARLEAPDAGGPLLLSVDVHSPAPADGQVLVLVVRGPDGAVLKRGVAVTKYRTHDYGCYSCTTFRASID